MVNAPTSESTSSAVGDDLRALDSIDVAGEVAESIESGPVDRVELSNGIVLKLRPVPPLALREAAVRVPPPSIPIVHLDDRDRDEPNPSDPDYIRALAMYEQDQVFRVADVLMLLGTSIESLPDGVQPPESDEWADVLEALDLPVERVNKYKRYLSWMRLYAIPSEADIARIMASVVQLSGVTEVEVAKAAAAFRRSAKR